MSPLYSILLTILLVETVQQFIKPTAGFWNSIAGKLLTGFCISGIAWAMVIGINKENLLYTLAFSILYTTTQILFNRKPTVQLIAKAVTWTVFIASNYLVLDEIWLTELSFFVRLVAIYGIATIGAERLISKVLQQWKLETELQEESLVNAGKYIGWLERALILSFVLLDQWSAIGFLATAKSVFRFGDLSRSKDRKLTEYILIGTLLSYSIAIGIGTLARTLL